MWEDLLFEIPHNIANVFAKCLPRLHDMQPRAQVLNLREVHASRERARDRKPSKGPDWVALSPMQGTGSHAHPTVLEERPGATASIGHLRCECPGQFRAKGNAALASNLSRAMNLSAIVAHGLARGFIRMASFNPSAGLLSIIFKPTQGRRDMLFPFSGAAHL
jgi:hypothetical protein